MPVAWPGPGPPGLQDVGDHVDGVPGEHRAGKSTREKPRLATVVPRVSS